MIAAAAAAAELQLRRGVTVLWLSVGVRVEGRFVRPDAGGPQDVRGRRHLRLRLHLSQVLGTSAVPRHFSPKRRISTPPDYQDHERNIELSREPNSETNREPNALRKPTSIDSTRNGYDVDFVFYIFENAGYGSLGDGRRLSRGQSTLVACC